MRWFQIREESLCIKKKKQQIHSQQRPNNKIIKNNYVKYVNTVDAGYLESSSSSPIHSEIPIFQYFFLFCSLVKNEKTQHELVSSWLRETFFIAMFNWTHTYTEEEKILKEKKRRKKSFFFTERIIPFNYLFK